MADGQLIMFKLTFLGTSSGIPTKRRNVSALAVELPASEQETTNHRAPWLLIDCGEGTQHQLMYTKLRLSNLCAICITHVHGDHCYGLAGLLASLAMHGRTTALTIIAPKGVFALLDAYVAHTELRLSFAIERIIVEHDQPTTLSLDNQTLNIKTTALSHRCPSYAFIIKQAIHQHKLNIDKLVSDNIPKHFWHQIFKTNLPHQPIRINNESIIPNEYIEQMDIKSKIVIAGDNDTPELLTDVIHDADALVHEATYTQAILDKVLSRTGESSFDPQHSSAKMVTQFAQRVKLPNLILTHFSARFAPFYEPDNPAPNMGHVAQEISQHYQGYCVCAEDFMSILINDKNMKIMKK